MSKVVAVIVTYNRKEKLVKCIEHLLQQTYSTDIIIVDNESTDGTRMSLKTYIDNEQIIYHSTGENLGGAGGFSEGIKYAYRLGYDFFWIMDDDCMPKKDSLENLMLIQNQKKNCGFLASKVLWKDGNICTMNIQRETPFRKVRDFSSKTVNIAMASFVSLLVSRKVVKDVGLPIKEFFIWTDDWEFTRRISQKYDCYLVNDSIVIHDSATNIGANIASDDASRIQRYSYLYRNDVYLYRREGYKGFVYEVIRLTEHVSRVALKAKDNRWKRMKTIFVGTSNGLKFHPRIKKVN